MTTTEILISFTGFVVVLACALLAYIWQRADKRMDDAVTAKQCEERRENEAKELATVSGKLCSHYHDKDGNVQVRL